MVIAGVAMYLLFTLITRFVQTPPSSGYGYGLSDFQAGLVLVPFSLLGFTAGRIVPRLRDRISPFRLLAANAAIVFASCVLFATTRDYGALWPIAAMAVLGFGVGGVSATMPPAILAVTPDEDTAAAMSVNQVARSVGFSIGSALCALLLAANTASGDFLPDSTGYATTAWTGAALAAATTALALLHHRKNEHHPA